MRSDVQGIINEFAKVYPNKEVLQIVDFREKGIYVVFAIPKNQIEDRKEWLDGLHSVDMDTLKIVDGFQPLDNDSLLLLSLGKDRIIYKKQ